MLQVAPSIGATYGLYALFSKQWGMGGIRQYPHGTAPARAHDVSSLRIFASTGEPWNPEPWWFLF